MLDRELIRRDPEFVREGIRRKRMNPLIVDEFLAVDAQWRAVRAELDEKRAELRRLSNVVRDAMYAQAQV